MSSQEMPLLAIPSLKHLLTIRLCSNTANQMLALVVGWQVYDLTGQPLNIALIGLAQFLPPLLLTLPAGHIADRADRRRIIQLCYGAEIAATLALALVSLMPEPPLALIYPALLVNALGRTFELPTMHTLLPMLVPREQLGRAVPVYQSVGKIAMLGGPVVGGLLYAAGGGPLAYGACAVLIVVALGGITLLTVPFTPKDHPEKGWRSALAGLEFILRTKPLLGAMSLDLVATLFGGVNAMLPIFARDILMIGPEGLGVLRSAPALGAFTVAALLARFPVRHAAGRIMYTGLVIYGLATIGFGLSTSAVLSFLLLFTIGAGDMLSGVIRQTLIQLCTPEDRRGRVLAVNTLSNGTAGQLGMVESGVAAQLLGASGSVVFGGAAVLLICAVWWRAFPALATVDNPTDVRRD